MTLLNFLRFAGPVLCVIVVLVARAMLPPSTFDSTIMGEQGLIELGTVVVLLVAIVLGVMAIRATGGPERLWLIGVTVGAFYFAGEEVSWGQHLVGWETPETIGALNDQNETNLHNISSWLDQKPRLGLELWVLALGVAGWVRYLQRWPWLFGRGELAFVALATIGVRLPERFEGVFYDTLPYLLSFRLAEWQEWMFAWVMAAWCALSLRKASVR